MASPTTILAAVVLGTPDPRRLAAFYAGLLGWAVVDDQPQWVRLANPAGGVGLSFQYEPHFTPPVWPAEPDQQQMTAHLDIAVDDLDAAVAWACAAGAIVAARQPQPDVRVLLDPHGHPFCLFPAPPRGSET